MNDLVKAPASIFNVEQLSVVYNAQSSPLQGLTLSIRAGEITCILGQSGCGKTTLLKALGGFIVGEGTGGVLFQKRYLQGPTPDIVMIFQENNLFPWLSVRGNIEFGLKFKDIDKSRRKAAVDAMLDLVGLSAAAARFPQELSGGMRQRTAIGRALISNPQVLLLDEPFSALDISLRRRMHALMHDLWVSTRKSMVMVTHNVEEAISVGHRVIVLGGSPAQVLIDRDTSAPEMKDRYSKEFLDLQRTVEAVIYGEHDERDS